MRMAVLLLALASCEDRARPKLGDLAIPHRGVEMLPYTFEELYPTFLYRKSMSEGDKSALWSRFRGRWVRWEGVMTSITDKGITIKHLAQTSTFDVSLICEADARKSIRQRFTPGARVRYVGMLDSYDDIFRTLYLTHGTVIEQLPNADLGVIADMTGTPLR
jgi:hypothetical protein